MLKADNIHKSYGTLQVLKGVQIHVAEKEIVSIVGASGAGKSTLLHILGTLDQPEQGVVTMRGKEITSLGRQELARFRNKELGFVFQFHNLLAEFSALENVCIPGFIAGTPEKQVRATGAEIMARLGLSERMDHKPSQLSGGEQQRTAVARALINDPSLVFADEPSGNLDTKNAEELHQLFFDLRGELGKTFVIVTHNDILAGMADRKLEMVDGVIVGQ